MSSSDTENSDNKPAEPKKVDFAMLMKQELVLRFKQSNLNKKESSTVNKVIKDENGLKIEKYDKITGELVKTEFISLKEKLDENEENDENKNENLKN